MQFLHELKNSRSAPIQKQVPRASINMQPWTVVWPSDGTVPFQNADEDIWTSFPIKPSLNMENVYLEEKGTLHVRRIFLNFWHGCCFAARFTVGTLVLFLLGNGQLTETCRYHRAVLTCGDLKLLANELNSPHAWKGVLCKSLPDFPFKSATGICRTLFIFTCESSFKLSSIVKNVYALKNNTQLELYRG